MYNFIQALTRFDIKCLHLCLSAADRLNVFFAARMISHLGDGVYYLLLGMLLAWLEPNHGSLFLSTGLLAFAIELPLYLLLKNSIKRSRPQDVLHEFVAYMVPSDKFSFPSGHTAAAFVMATITTYYYPEFSTFSFILASIIGFSRVILGVHFVSDIVAGAIFGTGSAVAAIKFLT